MSRASRRLFLKKPSFPLAERERDECEPDDGGSGASLTDAAFLFFSFFKFQPAPRGALVDFCRDEVNDQRRVTGWRGANQPLFTRLTSCS